MKGKGFGNVVRKIAKYSNPIVDVVRAIKNKVQHKKGGTRGSGMYAGRRRAKGVYAGRKRARGKIMDVIKHSIRNKIAKRLNLVPKGGRQSRAQMMANLAKARAARRC